MISTLDTKEYYKLIELAEAVNLDEKIDFKCTFLIEKNKDNKIAGAAGIRFGYLMPRFEHIIVRKEYQKKRLAFRLMKATEKMVKEKGYETYVALIDDTNKRMREYAIKFGFIEYEKSDGKAWFYKQL